MTRNIKFSYLYRDASNYKQYGEVVFANPDRMDVRTATEWLRSALREGVHFIASQARVPDVFLWDANANYDPDNPPAGVGPGGYVVNEDDHCWHEFAGLTETNKLPTDEHGRALVQFIKDVAQASASGLVSG